MERSVDELLREAVRRSGPLVFLTGAGVSAESGIPTFRGPEGFWTTGSRNYRPMELATRIAFENVPGDVWGWYLFRRATCRAARPNAAHRALADAENALGDRFLLVTQNVDGLHPRAGNSEARMYQIHGNIDFMRCSRDCSRALFPLPAELGSDWPKGMPIGERERELLRCPRCGVPSRPHVLWFDEYYDEEWFRFESSMRAVAGACALVVIGTSGTTNLPTQMCTVAARRGVPFVVVDVEPTVFSDLALDTAAGAFARATACEAVPRIVEILLAR